MIDTLNAETTTTENSDIATAAVDTATSEGQTAENTTEGGEKPEGEDLPKIPVFVPKTVEELATMTTKERRDYNKAMLEQVKFIEGMNDKDKKAKKDKAKDERLTLLDLVLGLPNQKIKIEVAGTVKEMTIEQALKGEYHMIAIKGENGEKAEKQEGDEVQEDGTVLRKHFFVLNGQRTKAITAAVERLILQMENKPLRKPRSVKAGTAAEGVLDGMEDGSAPSSDDAGSSDNQPKGEEHTEQGQE